LNLFRTRTLSRVFEGPGGRNHNPLGQPESRGYPYLSYMQLNPIISLIYHELYASGIEKKYKYAFSSKEFSDQLDLIRQSKLQVITVDKLLSQLTLADALGNKRLLITFDDGHKSNYEIALPHLIEYNLKATFFITTDWIGKVNYLNKNEIAELYKQGMSIQSHCKTHGFLDQMPKQDIYTELYSSKSKIENIIGDDVSSVSIPGGRFNEVVIQCAREVGYKIIFTSMPFQLIHKSDIWLVGRTGMMHSFNRSSFSKLLSPTPFLIFKTMLTMRGKHALRFLIGGKLYYTLWKWFVKK